VVSRFSPCKASRECFHLRVALKESSEIDGFSSSENDWLRRRIVLERLISTPTLVIEGDIENHLSSPPGEVEHGLV